MANRVNQIAINKAKEYATDFDPNYRIFKDMTQLNTLADEGVNMYVDNKIKQLQALPTRTPEQTKEMQDIIAIKDDQLAVNQTFAQQREAVKVQMVEAQQQIKPMNDIEYISNDVAINQLRYDNLKESL
jgi:hypothetical protein